MRYVLAARQLSCHSAIMYHFSCQMRLTYQSDCLKARQILILDYEYG